MSGFSSIRFRSKVTKHFQNCEKTMRSERAEMAFKQRIFRIVEFRDRFLLVIYFSSIWPNFTEINQIVVELYYSWKCPLQAKIKIWENSAWKKILLHKQVLPLTPLWKISQSFCKLFFLPVTSCENFLTVLHVLAFQSNQLLHHFVGYLRCLLYGHVDFVICNDYGKNKMGTEADFIKQSC